MQINLSNNLHRIFLGLAFLLVFISGFYGTLSALMVHWSGTESAGYSHGFLVLLCSLYLLWLRKDAFAATPVAPFKLALIPLLLCSLVWFVAKVAEIQSLQMLSILGILFFMVPAMFGLAWLKLAFIPLVILLFALPIWQPVLPLLQDITTAVTHFNLKLIGRPVYVVENFVHVSGGSFVIEESCSGLRFLLVATTLSLVNSSMNLHTVRQTISLLSIAIAFAFVANWVRVLIVILIGDYTRMQSSIVDDHANLGWVIFMVLVLVPYFIVSRRFPFNAPARQPFDPDARKTVTAGIAIVGVALMAAGPLLLLLGGYRATRNEVALSLPDQVAGMTANTSAALASQDWMPAWLNPTQTYFREYGSDPGVELHVAWYAQQSQGAELINVENSIVAPEHWSIVPASTDIFEIEGAPATGKVNRLRVVNGRGQQKQVWYWFNVGGKATANEIDAKLLQILQIFQGRSDASLFAVAVDCTPDCDGNDVRFERFIQDFSATMTPQ